MKAIMFTEYGTPDVLKMKEVAKPTPKDNEILVKVHATPVNYGDLLARNFGNLTPSEFNMPAPLYLPSRMAFGWNKPKINILGSELAGEVEAVGKDVTKFKAGDQVFAYLGMNMGANAEYVCIPETGTVALKPVNLSYEEAATLPYGAIMATSLLGKANICSVATKSPHQWRFGRNWLDGGPACQTFRRGSDWRLRHAAIGIREIPRRGQGHRLHQRGLHQKRRDLRPDLRHPRQEFVFAGQAFAQAERHLPFSQFQNESAAPNAVDFAHGQQAEGHLHLCQRDSRKFGLCQTVG